MVGGDLGNPLELGRFVSEQHEPVGAGVGAVEHAKPVRGGLHVEHRPHLAVDGRERRERLHHVGVGLVHELSGQPFLVVDVEVAVLNQQRQLERRSLRQLELALALVADDPEPGEPGVHVVLGDAHDVVVVPEQRRALIHRVVKDRGLTGREQVLRPAVVRRRGEAAVEVHDRVTGERGRVFVRRAAAQSRYGLHGHAIGVGRLGRDGDDDRQRAVELVAPLERHGLRAFGLDRRTGHRSVEAPDSRLGQVAMKAVRPGADRDGQPAAMLRCEQARRDRKRVDERHQRLGQHSRHRSSTIARCRLRTVA